MNTVIQRYYYSCLLYTSLFCHVIRLSHLIPPADDAVSGYIQKDRLNVVRQDIIPPLHSGFRLRGAHQSNDAARADSQANFFMAASGTGQRHYVGGNRLADPYLGHLFLYF